jgi:hypothetical protein
MAARTIRIEEIAVIKLGNFHYLLSFDLLNNSFDTFLIKTKEKLDLKCRRFNEVGNKLQDFLYYFGVGVFTKAYHFPVAHVNSLFKQGALDLELEFSPKLEKEIFVDYEEEFPEKAETDRPIYHTLDAQKSSLNVIGNHFHFSSKGL